MNRIIFNRIIFYNKSFDSNHFPLWNYDLNEIYDDSNQSSSRNHLFKLYFLGIDSIFMATQISDFTLLIQIKIFNTCIGWIHKLKKSL